MLFWVASCFIPEACASSLDVVGVPLLRAMTTNLDGSGIPVAQVEAPSDADEPPAFEVNPTAVGQPTNLFTYYSSYGSNITYPNSVGRESGHADWVAGVFYGFRRVWQRTLRTWIISMRITLSPTWSPH